MTSIIIDKRYCGSSELRERRICLRPAGPAHSRRRGGNAARTASPG